MLLFKLMQCKYSCIKKSVLNRLNCFKKYCAVPHAGSTVTGGRCKGGWAKATKRGCSIKVPSHPGLIKKVFACRKGRTPLG